MLLANRRHRRRRRNPGIGGMVKDLGATFMNGAVDSLYGSAGWVIAQAASKYIPLSDTSSSEILGLQPIDTLKRIFGGVAAGVIAKRFLRVSDVHARMLVMGAFLNTTLSVVESLLPVSLAGGLGLYPGSSQLSGSPFAPQGFFPPLPGAAHGDMTGDPAFMGTYYGGH